MKLFALFALLLACSIAFCQESPMQWSARGLKKTGNQYEINIASRLARGWYIYAETDKENDLAGLSFKWDLESVKAAGPIRNSDETILGKDPIFNNKKEMVYRDSLHIIIPVSIDGTVPDSFRLHVQGFAASGKELLPVDTTLMVALEGGLAQNTQQKNRLRLATVDLNKPAAACGSSPPADKKGQGLFALFLLGIAGGLIALLTPCVFPMIPVTVSFFTNRASTKKQGIRHGILYGGCIFLIYLLASVPFHIVGNINPEILNTISTNSWVNLVFFVVFLFFSLSFFGLFEITLPSGIVNKTDSKSGTGSIAGIFFMALTLATVSFSCTGPILGSLLVSSLSSNGDAWQLTAGMGGFGFALALPFALFAIFPNWLKNLPRSGGWLSTTKKVLAFLELALAFKFLSNADLVQHWGILKREIFIGIWMLVAAALALYLFGAFEKSMAVSNGRKIFGAIVLAFAVYLVPGLTNSSYANLKLLSGFPPPLSYSLYSKQNDRDDRLHPNVINDYQEALALSKKEGKPLLIDFTGWACVNCRKMEEQVWTQPQIQNIIKNKFILVSLYVDDRKKLPASEQGTYQTRQGLRKDILTVGDQWATFQSENFEQVTQPMYVILGPDEKLLNLPVGYTPDGEAYRQWLECGLRASRQ